MIALHGAALVQDEDVVDGLVGGGFAASSAWVIPTMTSREPTVTSSSSKGCSSGYMAHTELQWERRQVEATFTLRCHGIVE